MLDALADAPTWKWVDEKEAIVLYVVLGPVTHRSEGMT